MKYTYQTATFQLALATSISDLRTYAIYLYPDGGLNWNNNDVVVFIGYATATSSIPNFVSQYSNLLNSRASPRTIYSRQGNGSNLRLIKVTSYNIIK